MTNQATPMSADECAIKGLKNARLCTKSFNSVPIAKAIEQRDQSITAPLLARIAELETTPQTSSISVPVTPSKENMIFVSETDWKKTKERIKVLEEALRSARTLISCFMSANPSTNEAVLNTVQQIDIALKTPAEGDVG